MGEHKHNPTATAAKNGELPPKKKPMGTAESRAWVHAWIREHTLLPIMGREIRRNCDGSGGYFYHGQEVQRHLR